MNQTPNQYNYPLHDDDSRQWAFIEQLIRDGNRGELISHSAIKKTATRLAYQRNPYWIVAEERRRSRGVYHVPEILERQTEYEIPPQVPKHELDALPPNQYNYPLHDDDSRQWAFIEQLIRDGNRGELISYSAIKKTATRLGYKRNPNWIAAKERRRSRGVYHVPEIRSFLERQTEYEIPPQGRKHELDALLDVLANTVKSIKGKIGSTSNTDDDDLEGRIEKVYEDVRNILYDYKDEYLDNMDRVLEVLAKLGVSDNDLPFEFKIIDLVGELSSVSYKLGGSPPWEDENQEKKWITHFYDFFCLNNKGTTANDLRKTLQEKFKGWQLLPEKESDFDDKFHQLKSTLDFWLEAFQTKLRGDTFYRVDMKQGLCEYKTALSSRSRVRVSLSDYHYIALAISRIQGSSLKMSDIMESIEEVLPMNNINKTQVHTCLRFWRNHQCICFQSNNTYTPGERFLELITASWNRVIISRNSNDV